MEATVDTGRAGAAARELLHAFAAPGPGADFVAAAIEESPSENQDPAPMLL